MKPIIFSIMLILIILITGCDNYYLRITDNHYLTNNTDKQLVYELIIEKSDVYTADTLYVNIGKMCNDSLIWVKSFINGRISYPETGGFYNYGSFYVYNLTDTTSVNDNFRKSVSENTNQFTEFFIYKDGGQLLDSKKQETNKISNYYVIIDNSFIKLFHKDYTMLNKFKKYYKK